MSINPRLVAILLPIVALLVAIGYWNIRPETFGNAPQSQEAGIDIDYYAVNARSQQFLADGSLRYQMSAERLEHRKSTDQTYVTRPDILIYREGDNQPWHIRSQRGEVSAKGEQVDLIEEVSAERRDLRNRLTRLTTSQMSVFPERQYAQTDRPVRIEAPIGVTTANGMEAYLNEGRMILQSNVRGQHEAR